MNLSIERHRDHDVKTKQRLAYKSRGSLGVDLKSTVIL